LGPAERASAFRVPAGASPGVALANSALRAALGPLAPGDDYLRNATSACPNPPLDTTDRTTTDAFVRDVAAGVRMFITDARYDAVIYAPAIPVTLAQWAQVTLDTAPRPGVDRPGWFTVVLSTPGSEGASRASEVRFPPYAASGHMVNITEPQPLHDDVAAWLQGGP
ncbi:MAG: hypothetical protein JOZ69_04325, partial [Myxococcales bacterium]|nr:hypothetical protein [Myxococcales bacterium]